MARLPVDQQHDELVRILDELLNTDTNITAREVARRHSSLSSASTITRHPGRRPLLEGYQRRQDELRQWKGRVTKMSRDDATVKLAKQEARIAELEMTVKTLTQGHLALIAGVAQVGGMGKLAKFYEHFRDVRNRLYDAGALPTELPSPTPLTPHTPSHTGRK